MTHKQIKIHTHSLSHTHTVTYTQFNTHIYMAHGYSNRMCTLYRIQSYVYTASNHICTPHPIISVHCIASILYRASCKFYEWAMSLILGDTLYRYQCVMGDTIVSVHCITLNSWHDSFINCTWLTKKWSGVSLSIFALMRDAFVIYTVSPRISDMTLP